MLSLRTAHLPIRIASTIHLCVVVALLASFPVLLPAAGALAVLQLAPDSSRHTAALLRFCVVITGYIWLLFAIVWAGVKKNNSNFKLKDLIGVSAAKSAGVLKTCGATLATFALLLVTGGVANALINSAGLVRGTMQGLTVRNPLEAFAFLTVALSAGFVEEVVFRGYLQQQLYSRAGNILIASVLQIAIFTLGHMYQGWARLIPVALEGTVLTLIALWRKSLVPGMIAHGVGDGLIAIAFLIRLTAK